MSNIILDRRDRFFKDRLLAAAYRFSLGLRYNLALNNTRMNLTPKDVFANDIIDTLFGTQIRLVVDVDLLICYPEHLKILSGTIEDIIIVR